MGEKKIVGGWWLWILLLFVVTIVVISALNYADILNSTVVKRKVFENSFQYSEARRTEIVTFEAQLAEINNQLLSDFLDPATRSNLESQRVAINVMLRSARERRH